MVAKIAPPATGPVWLPAYTRAIEREIDRNIALLAPDARPVTGGITITANQYNPAFLLDVSGLTLDLPSAVNNEATLSFKLRVPGFLTLRAKSGQKVEGAQSLTLNEEGEAVSLISDGSNWNVLMAYRPAGEATDALNDIAEAAEYTEAAMRALVHLNTELLAAMRGQCGPPLGEEGHDLIREFMKDNN